MVRTEDSVVILSGGMDSATLLWEVIKNHEGSKVYTLTFDYRQRHKKEVHYAAQLAKKAGVPNTRISLGVLNDVAPSSQTRDDIPVPHGLYNEENMKATVVPNRNMVMLSLAISYAIGIGASEVYYGAHAGDHTIYPDCRPEFIRAMDMAAQLCDWKPVHVFAPYSHMDKGEILQRGLKLRVPYELTWSCYEGGEEPCGKCGACTERAEAFERAGIIDPALPEE